MVTTSENALSGTVKVLLVDDQALIGESVRQMLAGEPDIELQFCSDPTEAIRCANELRPSVILQDLVMPEVDGLTLVRYFRANPLTRDVPLIVLSTKEEPTVKAEAFARGANDYLVKLPDRIELLARIRYHSRGYRALLERNEAYRRLAESRRALSDEIDQAAKYVQSLLPQKLAMDSVSVDWRFVPSMQLGGDTFGYHWLDEDHFAIFVLDVSGHGVGASLLAVTAMNVLTSQSLPRVDFLAPAEVLAALDVMFDMERHDGKYFTIWYGIYQPSSRTLQYAGGGHPPGVLFSGASSDEATMSLLPSTGPLIGLGMGMGFETNEVQLGDFARLFIYSDGAFEIQLASGDTWQLDQFQEFLSDNYRDESPMDRLLDHCHQLHGSLGLDDDLSILQCDLQQSTPASNLAK